MSGLYPETNGVLKNNDQPGSYRKETKQLANHPSMAGFFRENGYFTARVSKIFHMGVPGGIERGEPGGDDPDSWDYSYNVMGPETLSPGKLELLSPMNHHYGSNFARMILPNQLEEGQTDYLAASQAISILENRTGEVPVHGTNKQRIKKEAPFFLAVGLVRPHVPLIAPEKCFDPYPVNKVDLPVPIMEENVPEEALRRQNEKIWGMNELQKRETISAYMASVRFMDQQVGRILEALDRLELRKNTIVVFLSDHGYNLGEHDCWSKTSLWEGTVRVPMIISIPGKKYKNNYGKTCSEIVELIDLYPTLTNLGGYAEKMPEILQGRSLDSCLMNPEMSTSKNGLAYTISYQGKAATIRTDKWRYTRWGEEIQEENEELYDHEVDPEENHNLINDPDVKSTLDILRQKLIDIRHTARKQLR